MPLLLSNEDIEQLLDMKTMVEAMETAYGALGSDQAVNRPRTHTFVPLPEPDQVYEFKTMEGGVFPLGVYALRFASDILYQPVVGGKQRREKVPALPGGRWLGFVLLFRIADGALLCMFPDGVVQGMRVGATSGLAARYLAREDARVLGLIGSGHQAQSQVLAMQAVRPLTTVRVFSSRPENRARFAREMSSRTGLDVQAVDSAREAVRGADIVSVATNSSDPVYHGEWLEPGQHLTALVGGDERYQRRELDDAAVAGCHRVFVNDREHIRRVDQRDILNAIEAGRLSWDDVGDLAELVAGRRAGRQRPDEITLFKNNVGLGMQFAAAGHVLYQRARAAGLGRELPLEWFTQTVHP